MVVEEKEKLIKELISKVKKYTENQNGIGGQMVGISPRGASLYSEECDFRVTVNDSRSQLKNWNLCLEIFKYYLNITIN